MKTKLTVVAVLFSMAAVAHAEPVAKKEPFWDKLQNKLEKLTPAKKAAATTAVGGVRGAKNDDAADIYWKGKEKTVEINEEELQKFNLSVEAKSKGDNELALKHFEEFLAQYPQSPLRVEGLQAAEKIRVDIAAAKIPVKVEAPPLAATPAEPAQQAAAQTVAVAAPAAAQPSAVVVEKTSEPAAEGQPTR